MQGTPTQYFKQEKMSRALSDEEASKEMKKMVTFIMQEATEKAKELRIKADEEFNIEKAKLVRQETIAIENAFSKKLNQTEVKRKIAQSNQINKTRLKILQFKDERLNEIIEETRSSLNSLRQDPDNYSEFILKLTLEILYRFMESEVKIECLPEDHEVTQVAVKKAGENFRSNTGIEVNIQISPTLYSECLGGLVGSCKGGKIRCSNTLTDRLNNLSDKALPEIRKILFGISSSRKFID